MAQSLRQYWVCISSLADPLMREGQIGCGDHRGVIYMGGRNIRDDVLEADRQHFTMVPKPPDVPGWMEWGFHKPELGEPWLPMSDDWTSEAILVFDSVPTANAVCYGYRYIMRAFAIGSWDRLDKCVEGQDVVDAGGVAGGHRLYKVEPFRGPHVVAGAAMTFPVGEPRPPRGSVFLYWQFYGPNLTNENPNDYRHRTDTPIIARNELTGEDRPFHGPIAEVEMLMFAERAMYRIPVPVNTVGETEE